MNMGCTKIIGIETDFKIYFKYREVLLKVEINIGNNTGNIKEYPTSNP